MINKILYIFIPILAVLLMSHNANAVSTVIDMSNYSVVSSGRAPSIHCTYSDNTTTNSSYCNSSNDKRITGFDMSLTYPNGFSFKKDDIIEFDLTFYSSAFPADLSSFGVIRLFANNNNFAVIDYKVTQDTMLNSDGVYTGTNTLNKFSGVITFHIVLRVNNDYTGIFGITEYGNTPFIVQSFYSNSGQVTMSLSNFVIYRKGSSNPINEEQSQVTQDAANNSQSAGNTATTDSQTATSSLLSVITAGVGAITSASPTNCKINGNMGNLDVGEIDLCANPVPTFMSLIGSIIAVLVVLPLVIVLFNRFISIIRSFQR